MENIVIIALVVLIVGAAACYIRRKRKQGAKCIGCPFGSSCPGNGCSGCSGGADAKENASS